MLHSLHNKIGELLAAASLTDYELVLDPACGGDQNLPLFVREPKSNATEYCNVDALFLHEGHVRGIVEIEEASILPTQVCGKYLTSALAAFYHHRRHGHVPIPVKKAFFLQVVDSSKLREDMTSKLAQLENLRDSIRAILPLPGSGVVAYDLVTVAGPSDDQALTRVIACVENSIRMVGSEMRRV